MQLPRQPVLLEQQGDRASSPKRTWVSEPPPFGVSSDRFKVPRDKDGPTYHVAYRDILQPPRRTAKGWVGIDDAIKGRRGTAPSTLGSSSLAPPAGAPQHHVSLAPLSAVHPNEVRLQELLGLQRRKLQAGPGPGQYEVAAQPMRRRFRRRHDPAVDGPLLASEMVGESTRVKEMAALMASAGDSGLGPGEYEGPASKDALLRSAPAARVGTADRSGRTAHSKSLSISRSIQHGIDWHVRVIVAPDVAGGPATAPPSPRGRARQGSSSGAGAAARPHSAAEAGGTASRHAAAAGGSGSRDTSPSGRERPGTSQVEELLLGAPPAPPAQVARALRREAVKKPGDWDWNRLGHNYRNCWTMLHGGAYSHGEHKPTRSSSTTSSSGSPSAYPMQQEGYAAAWMPGGQGQGQAPQGEDGSMWPILEEEGSLERQFAVALAAQQDALGGGSDQYPPWGQHQAQVSGPPHTAGMPASTQQPSSTALAAIERHVREQDLQRRRAASQAALHARQAGSRLAQWNGKFSG